VPQWGGKKRVRSNLVDACTHRVRIYRGEILETITYISIYKKHRRVTIGWYCHRRVVWGGAKVRWTHPACPPPKITDGYCAPHKSTSESDTSVMSLLHTFNSIPGTEPRRPCGSCPRPAPSEMMNGLRGAYAWTGLHTCKIDRLIHDPGLCPEPRCHGFCGRCRPRQREWTVFGLVREPML
jgi:hypothetical protein